MRKWINLFEEIAVPSFVNHVTHDLVDEILKTGKWVDHGDDLENTWDGGGFDGVIEDAPEGFWELPFEQVRNTPEFREVVYKSALQMAEQAYNELVHGSVYDNLPPLKDSTTLYRGITGEFDPNRPLGIFWSVSKAQAAGRFADDGNLSPGYCFTTTAGQVTINWEETIRSRLDHSSGADEAEIQLVKGSSIKARLYKVVFKDGWKPELTFIRDITTTA